MSLTHTLRHGWRTAATAVLFALAVNPLTAIAAPEPSEFRTNSTNRQQTESFHHVQAQASTEVARPAASELVPTDASGRWVELLITFDNPGVAPSARGDTAAAVQSLQQHQAQTWEAIAPELANIEADGEIEVLQQFWITNAILVKALREQEVIDRIASLPGVVAVDPNFTVRQLDQPASPGMGPDDPELVRTGPDGEQITYGLDKIGAARVWHDFDVAGAGIRVAVLDSGVDASHPDLRERLVGHNLNDPTYPGGWIAFDRYGNPIVSSPADPGSHGTHVSGTVLGGDSSGTHIGVAPKAELMVARALAGEGAGSFATILASLQWALAPHSGNSVEERVGRPANVINMSLGLNGYYDDLASIIRNIRDAGIFPAIAIGNEPCGDTGTSSPGNLFESVGVGMTTPDDTVHPDSCGAVVTWPEDIREKYGWPASFVKPDLSAPGSRVLSSLPDGRWGLSTGTSMATPHVAGAAALIMSAQAGLSVSDIETALQQTSYHPGGKRPDPRYGWGRIDVHAALSQLLGAAGISGRVTDAQTGEPVADAVISYAEISERWQTNADGNFQAKIKPGTYTLTVERFGYQPASVEVEVSEGAITPVTIALQPFTTGTITGMVIDHVTGEPIAKATVAVVGVDVRTETAADGSFSLPDLPVGDYRVRASAPGYSDSLADSATVAAGATTTINYRLVKLTNVLVVGDSGRSVDFLADHQLQVTGADALPDIATLTAANYDVIIVDNPPEIPVEQAQAFVNYLAQAGTGVLWLDLGNSETAGIAQISRLTGSPTTRSGGNDTSLTRIGYHIHANHPIFSRGFADGKGFTPDTQLVQNDRESGTKYYASFGDIPEGTILASTVVTHADGTNENLGNGIAVSEFGGHRSVYFALHGTAASFDTRNWSAASTQVFLNAIDWAAPQDASSVPPEVSEPQLPEPTPDPEEGPAPIPTDPDNPPWAPGSPGGGSGLRPPTGVAPPVASPPSTTLRPPMRVPLLAPPAALAPKPTTVPTAAFGTEDALRAAPGNGVQLELKNKLAIVKIPGAKPGDWYYLHMYPKALGVDWLRVGPDGVITLDIGKLSEKQYALAFTNKDGGFAGWVDLDLRSDKALEDEQQRPEKLKTTPAPAPSAPTDETPTPVALTDSGTRGLSNTEMALLGGSGLLFLAAAFVLVGAARRRQA